MSKTLVVGATTGGIGAAIVESMRKPQVETIFGSIYTPSPKRLDVTSEKSILDYLVRNGPFNHIVYSAGYNRLSWIRDETLQHLETTFRINTFGPALIAAHHESQFPEHDVNCLVVVSDAADIAMRGSLAYCSSKAAALSVVKNMARELAPNWRVNAISPGVVEATEMTAYIDDAVPDFRGWTPEEAEAYEMKSNPLGRRVLKQEVALVAVSILLGPPMQNGTNTIINGGK